MPKSLNWRFLCEAKIEQRSAYLNYIDIKMNAKTEKTNKSKCTICGEKSDDHQMQTSRLYNAKCQSIKYKSCHCLKTNNYIFYILNSEREINHQNEAQIEFSS